MNVRNSVVWLSSTITPSKDRSCPSINANPSIPCIDHQKKEECTPDIKQRQSQQDPPPTSRCMNNSMWLMHFCTLDSHIIYNTERQESFVRFCPRLDLHLTTCYSLSFAYSFHHKTTTLVLGMIQT